MKERFSHDHCLSMMSELKRLHAIMCGTIAILGRNEIWDDLPFMEANVLMALADEWFQNFEPLIRRTIEDYKEDFEENYNKEGGEA